MTIREVIEKLREEQQHRVPSRFHCRAILVRTIEEYAQLIDELKKLGGISTADKNVLFSNADVMPDYEALCAAEYQNQWLILPGVSEYLRLFHAGEEKAPRFGLLWHHQWDASTTGRILIPLWGCDTLWYDGALGLCGDERQKGFVFNCSDDGEPQRLDVLVLDTVFEPDLPSMQASHGYTIFGLQDWYDYWCQAQAQNTKLVLLTNRHRSIKPSDGAVKIHVLRKKLDYLRESLTGGEALNADNCPEKAQECLFPCALKGGTRDQAILTALNTQELRPLDVMGRWNTLSEGQRQLVFLWYELHPDDSYLCHCAGLAKRSADELLRQIPLAIFGVRGSHPQWQSDCQALMAAVPLARGDEYFSRLEELPTLEERLDYLTSGTAQERVYILRLVGQWLKSDPEGALHSPRLLEVFPALYAYLNEDYPDGALQQYFDKYKLYKLSNTLPPDEEAYFARFSPEDYELRYPVLCEEAADAETFVLWIDALGAEWLPLLRWALETAGAGLVSSARVTRALLPSETKFNDLWNRMDLPHEKYDKLDKLAHKGVVDDKDYYACVEEQLRFVTDIVQVVDRLLGQYARVIITGDHGTSRLAARFFHKRDAMPLPPGAEAGSHGRYCLLQGELPPLPDFQKSARDAEGRQYLVFANYDHYARSGFAAGAEDDQPIYGEIHGGASPEELLVPVITVNSRHGIPLTAKWAMPGNSIKIARKQAKCRVQFSRPVADVHATLGDLKAECTSTLAPAPAKEWLVTFSGLKVDKKSQAAVSLLADGALVAIDALELVPALGGGDPF